MPVYFNLQTGDQRTHPDDHIVWLGYASKYIAVMEVICTVMLPCVSAMRAGHALVTLSRPALAVLIDWLLAAQHLPQGPY
jgi:hypothetical protein